MPQFNYKGRAKTTRNVKPILDKLKKKQPGIHPKTNHSRMPTKIRDMRKVRHDIED